MEHSAWHELIKAQLPEHYFGKINQFLDYVYAGGTVYPPREKVFAAIQTTDLEEVKVVILGQDPYHGPGQAQGLSFSVPNSVPAPPSLQNILKELTDDIGVKQDHDLTAWAEQGVLLLNACLLRPACCLYSLGCLCSQEKGVDNQSKTSGYRICSSKPSFSLSRFLWKQALLTSKCLLDFTRQNRN
ncbi:uracil-DNA glycosylase family protein [Streptococcus suis]|uniref:uracil-DNA glycosylase family protein n=1 Tax=Streptococcus suis TaxID=1307 RepID=UPI003757F17F